MPSPILKIAVFGDALANGEKVAFWGDVKEWVGKNPALTGAMVAAPIGAMVGAKTTPEEEPEKRMTRAALGAVLGGAGGALLGKAVLPRLAGTGSQAPSPATPQSAAPAVSPAAATEHITGSPVRPAAAEPPSVSSRAITPDAAESRLRSSDQAIQQRAAQQADTAQRQAFAAKERTALVRDQVRTQMRTQQMLQPQTMAMPGSPRGFITITPGPGVQQVGGSLMPTQAPQANAVGAKVPRMGGPKYASLRDLTSALSGRALFKDAAAESHQQGGAAFGGLNNPGTETDTTAGEGPGQTRSVMFDRPPGPTTTQEKPSTDGLNPSIVPWPGAGGVRTYPEDVR